MTDSELTMKLYEAGAAPEGVKPREFDHERIEYGYWGYGPRRNLWYSWSPATDIAQAIEMAERLFVLWVCSYSKRVIRGAGKYYARVHVSPIKSVDHMDSESPARALSEAVLEAMKGEAK